MGSFDVVVAQYVITTVPDVEATLDEFCVSSRGQAARSCWSTTSAPRPVRVPSWRRCFTPLARRLGWHPEFRWQRLEQWAARHGGVRLIERRPMPPLGHFSLIRFAKA